MREVSQISFKGTGADDKLTLAGVDFQIGDFLDVTIYPQLNKPS